MSLLFRKRASPKTFPEIAFLMVGFILLIPIAPFLFACLYLFDSQKDRVTHLRFNSSLPDDEESNDDGDLLVPSGKLTSDLLVSLLNGCNLSADLEDESWEVSVINETGNHCCHVSQINGRTTLIITTPSSREAEPGRTASSIIKGLRISSMPISMPLLSNQSKRAHQAFVDRIREHLQTERRFAGITA